MTSVRRLLASFILSALCVLGLGAAEPERLCEDLDEILVVRGENVSVTGLWQIAAAELSATNAALTVCDGSLRFCEGAKFQTDDFACTCKGTEGGYSRNKSSCT